MHSGCQSRAFAAEGAGLTAQGTGSIEIAVPAWSQAPAFPPWGFSHALAQVYDRDSQVIEVDLTQEELAQLAGTTRPTLNRSSGRKSGVARSDWDEAGS